MHEFPGMEYEDKEKTRPLCPTCKLEMEKMCRLDHPCTCANDIHYGIRYCPECGKVVCPCGSSDVVGISRVTGYLQTIESFNRSKQQEVKDRHRWNLGDA
jgi:hypothetical protein